MKLDLIEIKNDKQQVINVGVLAEKRVSTKQKEPKKIVKKEPKKIVKKEPKKIVKKEPKKIVKKEPANEKKFDDLLKNLAKEELGKKIKKKNIDSKINELSASNLLKEVPEVQEIELSLIEKIILEQIDSNWTRPPGIKIAKNLVIKLIITLDANGKVIKLAVHKKTQADIIYNNTLQPYLDSAVRAIKKSSPFEGLRKDRYSIWKEIIINFKPIETR